MESSENAVDDFWHNPIPAKNVGKLFLDAKTADVFFNLSSDERIPAHKNLLSISSDVFFAMFYGELKEIGDVKIDNITANAFKEFLQFFYLNKTKLTLENISDVICLADKYNVSRCLDICLKFLKNTITDDNVLGFYNVAILIDHDGFKDVCESRIRVNSEKILQSNSFLECDHLVLGYILKMDFLSCSETDVFKACLEWVKASSIRDVVTKDILKAHLRDLFYEIRFGTMTIQEFASLIPLYEHLFSYQEHTDIVQTIASKEYVPKLFNGRSRQISWNEYDVMECNRIIRSTGISMPLSNEETTQFSTNQPIALGEICCAKLRVYRDNSSFKIRSRLPTLVKISEKSSSCDEERVTILRKYHTKLHTNTLIKLSTPILIRPGFFYTIKLEQATEGHRYEVSTIKSEVEMKSNTIIKFEDDISSDGYVSFITKLKFNPI